MKILQQLTAEKRQGTHADDSGAAGLAPTLPFRERETRMEGRIMRYTPL